MNALKQNLRIFACLLTFCFCFSNSISAQYFEDQTPRTKNGDSLKPQANKSSGKFDKEKLYVGGNFGLSFGNITNIDISPRAGYQFHRMFLAGVGVKYQYYSNSYFSPRYQQHIYGGQLFVDFRPIRFISLRAEIWGLQYDVGSMIGQDKNRRWVAYPLLGGAVNIPMGKKAFLTIGVLWNANHQDYSLYSSPFITDIGISFSL